MAGVLPKKKATAQGLRYEMILLGCDILKKWCQRENSTYCCHVVVTTYHRYKSIRRELRNQDMRRQSSDQLGGAFTVNACERWSLHQRHLSVAALLSAAPAR
eukprot:6200371-Pleurochrysis_carterae.AAC.1